MINPKDPKLHDLPIRPLTPKAVLFDWDNTLSQGTFGFYKEAINATRTDFDLPHLTPYEWKTLPHISLRDVAPLLFPEKENVLERIDHHFQKVYTGAHAVEGVEALLQFLKDQGVYMAIVSNKGGKYLREDVEGLGWTSYFGAIIGSGDCREDKPSAVPALAALEWTDIEPGHDVWFVGDSEVDLMCARSGGFQPVIIGEADFGFRDGACMKGVLHFSKCQDLKSHLQEHFEKNVIKNHA